MWDYSDKVMDHYRNPRNVGTIEDADAVGEAGSLSCGDMLKIFLKVDENGIITDAKFQTFGCGSAVASSSVMTEMIIGKHIDEARKLTNKQIADALDGLPPEKMHCSVMGHEALEAAIASYYNEEITVEVKDKVICKCFGITQSTLETEIKNNNLKTIEDVINYTKAGGACGKCQTEIKRILEDSLKLEVKEKDVKTLTKTQLILKINNIIDKHIASELQKDGGDIELVDVEDNKVYVKLSGKCGSCKRSQLTLKHFVEATLKEQVSPDIEIIEV